MAGLAGILTAIPQGGRSWLPAALRLLQHAPAGHTAQWHGESLGLAAVSPDAAQALEICQQDAVTLFVLGEPANVTELLAAHGVTMPARHRPGRAAQLLALYVAKGLAPLHALNGIFTVGIWDRRAGTLQLVTDRLNLQPVYYAATPSGLLFASEVKALLAHPAVSRTVDQESLGQFLALGYVLDDRTLYTAIRLLSGGHVLTYALRTGLLTLARHWVPRFVPGPARSMAAWADALHERLQRAVRRDLLRTQRPMIPLSGGWDSRTLLGLAQALQPEAPLRTLSVGHHHTHDVVLARRMARRCRSEHRFLPLAEDFLARDADAFIWLTDGLVNAYNSWCFGIRADAAQGSDRLFSGYLGGAISAVDKVLWTARTLETVEEETFRRHRLVCTDDDLRQLLKPAVYRRAGDAARAGFARSVREAEAEDVRDRGAVADVWQRQRRYIAYQVGLFGSVVPVSAPFADNDVLDCFLTMPFEIRHNRESYRQMLCRHLPRLAAVPDETHAGLPLSAGRVRQGVYWRWERLVKTQLPRASGGLWRPHDRREYAHYAEWMRQPTTRAYLRETLAGGAEHLGEWFDAAAVTRLVDRHMTGAADCFRQLSALLTLVLWFQQADRIEVVRLSAPAPRADGVVA